MPDYASILGLPGNDEEPDEKMNLALLLRLLADMMSSKRDEKHVQRPVEQGSQEIPVRPRIEPLGGA